MDLAIPMVFPAFLINVTTPAVNLDLVPFFEIPGDTIVFPARTERRPDLGHAGVLLIQGASGLTKYYEYGRYDAAQLGEVNHIPVRNVKMAADGRPTRQSLINTLDQISALAGQRGRISGAYMMVAGGFAAMLAHAHARDAEDSNPARRPYDVMFNSCLHFMREVVVAGGVNMPWVMDPRPVRYMPRVRERYPDLDYNPRGRVLAIEGIDLA